MASSFDDIAREMAAGQAGGNLYAAQGRDPEKVGRANKIAAKLGIPADYVEPDLPSMEARVRQGQANRAMRDHPSIGVWAADPRNAAIGADDMDALAKNARYWRDHLANEGGISAARAPAATFRNFFAGVWENFTQGGVTAKAGLQAAAADLFPTTSRPGGLGDFGQQNSLDRYRRAQSRADAAKPNFESSTMSGLYSGVSSFARMVPTVGVGLAAGAGAGLVVAAAPVGLTAYAKYRSRGASAGMAAVGGLGEGGVEAATEMLPMSFIVNSIGKIGLKPFIAGLLGREVPGEQVATLAQDAIDTAIANPDKTWGQYLKERPDAAYQTFVATLVPGILTGGASEVGRVVHQRAQAQQAETDAAFLDKLATGVADSKIAKRDPSAFAKFLEIQAQGTPVENLFIPAEKLTEYFQSNDMDYRSDDSGFSFDSGFASQYEEAVATGGDVVVKTSDFAAHLAGTPAWDALKDHVRMSPGGVSLAEAKDFAAAEAGAMEQMGADFAAQAEVGRAAMEPRQKLYQAVRDKLTNAGFTQSAADTNATLVAARYATRAARQGVEITGNEFDQVAVNQVLPERLAPIVAADQLDIVIEAMKRDRAPASDRQKFGPSLLEWISSQGGIEDRGGDLASMGLGDWHKGKPGKRKLIRPHNDDPSFLPSAQQNANTPDELALRAQEAGYLPVGDRPSIDDLLAAIDSEMHGKPTYAEDRTGRTEEVKAAADELAALLDQEGLDPATASVADVRKAVARYQAERMQGAGYDQSFNEGPRGRITFPAAGFGSGPSVIDLFAARDPSTFLHETGHLWLEELRHDATAEGATDQIKADWQAVQDWFAANGHDMTGGIPVDAHEMWARGVERFLMEGKAPSSALRKVFDTFRSWLVSIYQVVNNLRAPITPEIRDVMARLVATDAEIAEARLDQRIKVMFDDAAMAGMTGPQYEAYRALANDARDEAFDALLFRTMATVRRQATKAWKDERDAVQAEVAASVDARPEFRALAMLGKDGVRLDRAWLVETYGEDALALLPKRVPPIYGDKGTSADMIAEMNGFSTGDEMVRTLMVVGQRTQQLREGGDQRSVRVALIDEEVADIMRDRHGDPLSDASIEEQALTLIHNERQGEVIASELRELGKRSNRRPTPYSLARQWAQETIAQSKVADSLSGTALQRYARAARNAAKLAEEAMLAGDIDETFRQKQRQMLNNALIDEAGKAKAAIDVAVTKLAKVAKRATMKSVDQDYLEQAHALLEQVDFRNRPQSQITRRESFEAWAAAREAEGFDVVVPPSFADTLGKDNWSRLTVENLLGLKDAVDQILHLGRLKQTLLDNKERREFDAVVGEAQAAFANLPPKPPSDLMTPDWRERFKSGVAGFDAALLKMETLVDWLDGGNAGGVFNRVVFKPISDAQDRSNDMRADYQGRVVAAMRRLPEKTIARWQEKVQLPELLNRQTGRPFQMTRQELVAMALNMGNEGNIQRLTDGYGWNEQSVRDVLNRELKVEDWLFVQEVWDIIETLWPQIEAMEKRINGIAPEKVEALAVDTPAGVLRGGYYPAIYDGAKDLTAEQRAARTNDLFSASFVKANTTSSATKARALKNAQPILLQLGVINRHLGEVIHDITHREAVMNADKFISDRRIMEGVDGTFGPEYRKMFRPWLQFVANQHALDRVGNEGVGKFFTKARANTTVIGMGFRISTIVTQVAGYSNSFEYVGAKWVGQAILQAAQHPIETFNFMMERSGEARHRMDMLDRDVRAGIEQLAGKDSKWNSAVRFAFHGIGYADRVVTVPTWLGAYNKALAAGATEDAAVYEADKAIRKSQGAGSAKDLAAVQRGTGKYGEILKLSTMFYSYMSAMYQRQRSLGRDIRSADAGDLPEILSRALWLVIVPPLLSGILAGRGPEEDEDWGMWSFKQMLFNALGPLPGIRDAVQPMWGKVTGEQAFDYQMSPVQRAVQTVINAGGDVSKIVQGEETKRATRDILEAIGYFTGLVPGQIASTTQFIVDVAYGEQDPETVAEWYEGLTKGKIKDD